jgi:hypothetical protein
MSWQTRMSDNHLPDYIRRIAGILCGLTIALLALAPGARAQVSGYGRSSAPIYGSTGVSATPANPFPPMPGTYAPAHKAMDGTPCISVHPSSHPQTVNPKIMDQIVIVNNVCGQSIKVQVCYAGSSNCIIVPLNGYQKLQRVLGIAANSASFRFEYRELY